MTIAIADRVKETCSAPGTGTVTLLGAVTGFQSFATVGDGNTCYYAIADQSGANWETGVGTYTASGTTLSRDTVLSSSNAGSLVNFATGTQDVFLTIPAEKTITSSHGHFDSVFSGSYSDGVVIDYVSPNGRISVGSSDGLAFYNGGVAGSLLGSVNNNGDWSIARFLDVGNGTLVGGTTNPLIAAAGSANGYVEVYVHNDNSGTSASSDFVAYPDNGADATGWVDLGVNSSTFSDVAYSITTPNEGYLLMSNPSTATTATGNLVYATDSTGTSNAHQWYVGGFTQAKSAYKMQLNATNLLVKQAIQANGVIESTTGGFKFPDSTTQTTAASPFTGGTLTSQLKLAAGTATAATAPIEFTSGTLNTTAEAGAMEYDGTAFYSSMAASTRGVVPSEQIVVLTGTNTLTSQTAVQPIFDGGGGPTNGAITLPVGTYQFECFFSLSAMSATSGTFGFALGGTATKTQSWTSQAIKSVSPVTSTGTLQTTYNTSFSTALTGTSTQTVGHATIKGIIRVTVAGTVIPQVSLTVAAAAVVGVNSYFKISPIGNATVATVGNWS